MLSARSWKSLMCYRRFANENAQFLKDNSYCNILTTTMIFCYCYYITVIKYEKHLRQTISTYYGYIGQLILRISHCLSYNQLRQWCRTQALPYPTTISFSVKVSEIISLSSYLLFSQVKDSVGNISQNHGV